MPQIGRERSADQSDARGVRDGFNAAPFLLSAEQTKLKRPQLVDDGIPFHITIVRVFIIRYLTVLCVCLDIYYTRRTHTH